MAEKTLSIKLSLNDKQFQSNLKKSMRSMKKFGNNMKSLGRTISTGLTLPIIAFGAASVKAFDEQIKAETKLRNALDNSAEAFEVLKKQAQDLQKVTLFGDEATIEAQAMLATLGLTSEQIQMIMPGVQDFATMFKMDLAAAATLVGKSVGTTTDALARYMKTGLEPTMTQQERAIRLTDKFSESMANAAKTIATEGLGPLEQLRNELGDVVLEEFGRIILEFIDPLTKGLQKLSKAIGSLTDEQKKNIVQYGAILAAAGPVLILFGSLVTTISTLIPLFTAIAGGVSLAAAPFIAAAAAVGYFIKRIVDLQNEYEEYNKVVGDFEPIAPFVPTPTTPTAPAIQRSRIPERIEPIKAMAVALKEVKTEFETLKPIVEDFEEGLSGMDIVANDITQSFQSFGNIFQSVFAQALQSQEGFFKSFVEGTKRALAALAAQIASMLILNALLGGTSLGGLLGFKNIGGFGGIGQVLGGVGNVNANSVGGGGALRSMISTGGSTEVFGTISGADILLSSDRARNNRNRTRGY
jgi:cell division protein FtsB